MYKFISYIFFVYSIFTSLLHYLPIPFCTIFRRIHQWLLAVVLSILGMFRKRLLIQLSSLLLRWQEPTKDQRPKDAGSPKALNIIDQKSPVFIGTVTGLCGATLMFFIISMALKCLRRGNVHQQSYDLETGRVQGDCSLYLCHAKPCWVADE